MSLLGQLHQSLIYDRRIRRLSELLSRTIPRSCTVLDVGCGDGKLAWSLQQRRPDLRIEGVDVLIRERTWLPVKEFDGKSLPYPDSAFDAVMLIDVLHHTPDSFALLQEGLRVSRLWLVVKDHFRNGLAAGLRLRLMDYAGNSHHGVTLPYNYLSDKQWVELEGRLDAKLSTKMENLGLYRWPLDYIFGSGLHFIALYEKRLKKNTFEAG